MPPPTPMVDQAAQLIDDLAACLDANDLGIPADRGVVQCTPCIKPGCCDLLVAVMEPPRIERAGCIGAEWDVTVWWGTCYSPCATEKPSLPWLIEQEALARKIEQVITVLTTCNQCDQCALVTQITKFCEGGCAGVRVTYRFLQP